MAPLPAPPGDPAPATTAAPLDIRKLEREDLDAVLEIERASHPAPWTREVFLEETHRGWARLEALREQPDGPVRGYVNYWLVGDEVHILNLTVDPAARRRGLGARLLEHVLAFARDHRCTIVTLEVRRSNRGAIALYRRHHFRPVGLRPRYYGNGEDAVLMLRDL